MPSKVPLQKSPTSRDAHWLQGRRVTHGDRTMYAAPEALSVAWAAGQPGGTRGYSEGPVFLCVHASIAFVTVRAPSRRVWRGQEGGTAPHTPLPHFPLTRPAPALG